MTHAFQRSVVLLDCSERLLLELLELFEALLALVLGFEQVSLHFLEDRFIAACFFQLASQLDKLFPILL